MINTASDIDLLPRGVNSLSDYTPNKLGLLLKTSTFIDTLSSRPRNSDDSLNLTIRSHNRPKTLSKKKKSARGLYPIDRPRSPYHYEQDKYQQAQPVDACDMRFLIIRHGERVDRYFGSSWFILAFDQLGQYRPYHMNFPPHLPNRSNKYFWALDTPLTRDGLNAAQNVGRVLGLNQFQPSYVYSSSASRCILTTHQILKGLGLENKISIRIEPGLLELGAARFGMNVFLTPIEWNNYGVNVDLSYQPIITDIPATERENAYYLRSKHVIREIEQRHNNPYSSLLSVLLVGHATSPETLTWDLTGRQPIVRNLYTVSLNIGYLQMVITERKKQNKLWSLIQMPLQSTTVKWV
jgi:broad specificity phosphatase PhoE